MLLFLSISLIRCENTALLTNFESVVCTKKNETATVLSRTDLILHLAEWCSKDIRCRRTYFQDSDSFNTTVFGYLTSSLLDYYEETFGNVITYPLDNIVCNTDGTQKTPFEITKLIWVVVLKSWVSDFPVKCRENEDLVIDYDMMESQCVCKTNRNCSGTVNDLIYFYVMSALTVVLFGLFVMNVMNFKNMRNS
jgi:hypothetical protein